MKGQAKRKCLCCKEFFHPDHRNLRHQRYCSKPCCRKQSKAQSQRCWQQKPANQNYFRSPENCQRVKDWRKRHPGYWRKKSSWALEPLQEVFQEQATGTEELNGQRAPDALQDLLSVQPAVVVGLISMMTGTALQEDIAATVRVLVRKGRDILDINPGSQTTRSEDDNQTTPLPATAATCAASVQLD
jgi:hypothetical protein